MAALQIPVIEADAMLEGEAFEVVDSSAQRSSPGKLGDLDDLADGIDGVNALHRGVGAGCGFRPPRGRRV